MYTRMRSKVAAIVLVLMLSPIAFARGIVGHWAEENIQMLIDRGVVQGDQNGNINPDDEITRGEFVMTINKLYGFTVKSATNFPDVSEDAWYYDDFSIAKAAGYIAGDENGNANPNALITRQEKSAILVRVLGLTAKDLSSMLHFTDTDDIGDWAKEYVAAMVESKLVKGYPDGSFGPRKNSIRSESFTVLANAIAQGFDGVHVTPTPTPTPVITPTIAPTKSPTNPPANSGRPTPTTSFMVEDQDGLLDAISGAKSGDVIAIKPKQDGSAYNVTDIAGAAKNLVLDKVGVQLIGVEVGGKIPTIEGNTGGMGDQQALVVVKADNIVLKNFEFKYKPGGARNKLVDVYGDNVTIEDCKFIDTAGTAGIYLNGTKIKKYTIKGNEFVMSDVYVINGAGNLSANPKTDLLITNNVFNDSFIGFEGANLRINDWSLTEVVNYPVIEGNTFINLYKSGSIGGREFVVYFTCADASGSHRPTEAYLSGVFANNIINWSDTGNQPDVVIVTRYSTSYVGGQYLGGFLSIK